MIKQIIAIRKDLNMRRGKEIAQGAHSSMKFLADKIRQVQKNHARQPGPDSRVGEHFPVYLTESEEAWILGSFAKICIRVNTEEELLTLHQKALAAGLVSHLIQDNGKTEFNDVPTYTCLAIGPDTAEKIDPITREYKLY